MATLVKVVIADAALKQMVRNLLEYRSPQGTECPQLMIVGLTGQSGCIGEAAVRQLRSVQPGVPVIAISGADGAAITKQAVRLGVSDYFRLPEELAEFQAAALALLSGSEPPLKNSRQQNVLLGDAPQIVSLRKYVARVALTDSTVLITGETGTGKELVAELIHKSGVRRDRPFVCVNSAALPDTLLESELFGFEKGAFTGAYARYQGKLRMAHGGTVFLDEIGDLSLAAQAKILRALETREVHPLGGWRAVSVDFRMIAATNRDVEAITQSGSFRQDLFYRLNVVRIELPPLRERKQDIPRLLQHFIESFNRQFNRRVEVFHADAVNLLQSYDWPGNIRELRNVVEASFVNAASNQIEVLDLPDRLRRVLESQLSKGSREELVQALLAANWNISRAADELQCSRMTVYRKMAQYRVSKSCNTPSRLATTA
jgi:DNA-binding NtrC family response regulator